MRLALLVTMLALPACMKTDPASVRDFVIEEARMAFPDATIEERGDNEVALLFPSGSRHVLDVSAVQEGCKRVPRSCGSQVASLMIVMRDALEAQTKELTLSNVLPLLSGVGELVGGIKSNNPEANFVDVLAPGLALRYGYVTGDTFSLASEKQLAALKPMTASVRSAALANLDELAIVNTRPFPGEAKVHIVFGRMATTGLLLKKNLDTVRERLQCKEVAAAFPRGGLIFVADANSVADVARLREIAARFMQPASAVLSKEVYLLSDRSIAVIPNK